MIKNEKLSGYCFYMNTNKQGDFEICISVPLMMKNKKSPCEKNPLKKPKNTQCYLLIVTHPTEP